METTYLSFEAFSKLNAEHLKPKIHVSRQTVLVQDKRTLRLEL